MKAELITARQVLEELTQTIQTRRAAASAAPQSAAALAKATEEKAEAQKRIAALTRENEAVTAEVNACKEALIALAADDNVSVDSWLAPTGAPESPPHSPTASVRSSSLPSPAIGRSQAHATLYSTLYQYVGQSEDELSFGPNEIIELVDEDTGEEGWLKGRLSGKIGIFPENFCKKVVRDETASPLSDHAVGQTNLRAISIFAWKARKDNQLSFPKNALITVRKQGESWWAGELDGKIGWFPRSYVKLIRNEAHALQAQAEQPAEKARRESASTAAPKVFKPFVALYPFEGVEKGELSFRAKDVIMVTRQDGEWWEGQCNGATGQFPRKYVNPL